MCARFAFLNTAQWMPVLDSVYTRAKHMLLVASWCSRSDSVKIVLATSSIHAIVVLSCFSSRVCVWAALLLLLVLLHCWHIFPWCLSGLTVPNHLKAMKSLICILSKRRFREHKVLFDSICILYILYVHVYKCMHELCVGVCANSVLSMYVMMYYFPVTRTTVHDVYDWARCCALQGCLTMMSSYYCLVYVHLSAAHNKHPVEANLFERPHRSTLKFCLKRHVLTWLAKPKILSILLCQSFEWKAEIGVNPQFLKLLQTLEDDLLMSYIWDQSWLYYQYDSMQTCAC